MVVVVGDGGSDGSGVEGGGRDSSEDFWHGGNNSGASDAAGVDDETDEDCGASGTVADLTVPYGI